MTNTYLPFFLKGVSYCHHISEILLCLVFVTCGLVHVSEERLDLPRYGIETIRRVWTFECDWIDLHMCVRGEQLSMIQRVG